jgi:hypothetical protein
MDDWGWLNAEKTWMDITGNDSNYSRDFHLFYDGFFGNFIPDFKL